MVWRTCATIEEVYDVIKTAHEKMTVLVLFNGTKLSDPMDCKATAEELEEKYKHVNFVLVDANVFPKVTETEAFKATDDPTFAVYMRKAKVASILCTEVKKMEKTIQVWTARDVAKAKLPRRDFDGRYAERPSR